MKLTNSINKLHKVDISSLDQIQILVNSFYEKVRKDDELGPIFEKHIQDWKAHLPRMYQFWVKTSLWKGNVSRQPIWKTPAITYRETAFRDLGSIIHRHGKRAFCRTISGKIKTIGSKHCGNVPISHGNRPWQCHTCDTQLFATLNISASSKKFKKVNQTKIPIAKKGILDNVVHKQ